MGLGFEEMKDEFINSVLDVRMIFPAKLSILPKVDLDDVQRDSLLADVEAPDVLMRNIERLAIEINEQYRRTSNEEKPSFYELSSDLKMSNIRQAKSIPKKLALIGCEIAHKTEKEMADTTDFDTKVQQIIDNKYGEGKTADDINDEIIEENSKIVRILKFSDKDINDLAIFEHDEWCDEREGKGWTRGAKSIEDKTTPSLVEWSKLDSASKQYDIDAIKNIPKLLDNIGLKIIRSRLRALTYKMNQFYEYGQLDSNSSGEEEFKVLDNHIQFCNFKQANHLVLILRDKGYEFVSIDDPREAVSGFDYDEIEHFAKREHESWYKLKLNLNEVSNVNFVEWDDLDRKVKHKNRETIRHLPEMCADEYVGLKIVRSE